VVYIPEPCEPELMYHEATLIVVTQDELLAALKLVAENHVAVQHS
jgi:hypothetical protein